ncbi:glucose-6-phosphate dehydrogenase [Microbacterium sp. CJ88]|uniref:glucose-6-phosphate dehydrogenase n=1 Tax=Microbacterium sp. CJ88 TaxID=3445672 RepID=UPI003F65FA3A
MKIVTAADWRNSLPFDTPFLVADLAPGEPARCAACGTDAEPLPRTELWAVKYRHPKNHAGFVRFSCAAHTPRTPPPAAAAPARPRRAAAEKPIRRPATTDAAPRAMCPDCFVEVSAKGLCGICGRQL